MFDFILQIMKEEYAFYDVYEFIMIHSDGDCYTVDKVRLIIFSDCPDVDQPEES